MPGFCRNIFLIAAFLFATGCAPTFKPVTIDIKPLPGKESRGGFPFILIKHLAEQRDVAFARDYQDGLFVFRGILQSDDRRHTIFLLKSTSPKTFALPYAYVYILLEEDPYLKTEQNTSSLDRLEGVSTERDARYKGLYRLSLINARMCLGEAKELPVIEGNDVKLKASNRMMRLSMYNYMVRHYTPTTCQGGDNDSVAGSPPGVRFYFNTQEEMERFVSALSGTLPLIKQTHPDTGSGP